MCQLIRHIVHNPNSNGWFAASYPKIANMTGCSVRTVSAAISHFLACKVIFRPAEYKGQYEGKSSEYTFRTKLMNALREYEKQYKEEAKAKTQAKRARAPRKTKPENSEVIAANAEIARERFYAARRQKAEDRAEKFKAFALLDPAFAAAETAVKKGEIELARAEVYAPHTLPEVQMRLGEAQKARTAALLRLDLSEEDFEPQWECKACSDTGNLPDGKRCNCYSPSPRGAP